MPGSYGDVKKGKRAYQWFQTWYGDKASPKPRQERPPWAKVPHGGKANAASLPSSGAGDAGYWACQGLGACGYKFNWCTRHTCFKCALDWDFKKRTASPPPKEEVGKGGPSPKVGSKTLGASGPHFFRHSDASDGETHTAYEDVDDDCDMEGKPPTRPKLPFSAKQQEDLLVEAKKNMEALEKIGLLGGESLQTMQN